MFMASYDNYSSGHALKDFHQIGRWKLASHDTRFFLTVLRLDWYFVGFVQLNDSLFVEIEIGQSVVVDDSDGPFTVKAFDANHCPETMTSMLLDWICVVNKQKLYTKVEARGTWKIQMVKELHPAAGTAALVVLELVPLHLTSSLENPVMTGLDDKKIQLGLSSEDFGSLGFDVNDELEQPDKLTSSPIIDFRAEVRGIQQDGLHLQARSQKYGKLQRGQLLTVPPYLVRRRKQHFHHLELCRVDLILGCNGFICVGEHVEAKDDMVEDQASKLEQQNIKYNKNSISLEEQEQTYTLIETRQSTCRIANAVRVLSILGFNIAIEVIMDTMNLSSSLNLDIHEMLDSELCVMC
ncbi:exosome complex component rrp4 like protein [Quercus suber]|uniref:Exosome complex component rrp4 like protein n=1 Tax=Quercus suber TaxID=58331 RepID=A0AAW0K3J2_QUESU